eukprot:2514559-Amphidinium_carterae.1
MDEDGSRLVTRRLRHGPLLETLNVRSLWGGQEIGAAQAKGKVHVVSEQTAFGKEKTKEPWTLQGTRTLKHDSAAGERRRKNPCGSAACHAGLLTSEHHEAPGGVKANTLQRPHRGERKGTLEAGVARRRAQASRQGDRRQVLHVVPAAAATQVQMTTQTLQIRSP